MQRLLAAAWPCTGLLVVGLATTVACGGDDDDDNPGNPDAADIDASDMTPDAAEHVWTLADPEGGEVRVEYVDFIDGAGPGGRNDAARVTAFIQGEQTPASFPPLAFPGCTNMMDDTHWPTAQAEDRTYIDVGQVIIAGGTSDIVVEEGGTGADPFGRIHALGDPLVAQPWDFHFGVNDASILPENSKLDVIFTGSDEWPAAVYNDAITIPKAQTLESPGFEAVQLTPGEDLTLTWSVEDTDTDLTVSSLVGFLVTGQGPVVTCVEANDGSVTVPAAMVDELLAVATSGVLARQTFVHHIVELKKGDEPTGRRLDLVGVWCQITPWSQAP
jgi:hypothetical protein